MKFDIESSKKKNCHLFQIMQFHNCAYSDSDMFGIFQQTNLFDFFTGSIKVIR